MKFSTIIGLFTLVILGASCKKYLDIPAPTNQLVSELVFADNKTATATVAGLYSNLNAFNSSFANYNGSFLPAFSADEFHYTLSSADLDEFKDNNVSSENSSVDGLWEPVYSYIFHANAIIEGLNGNAAVTESVKKQLTGEAKFLRAFFYFNLVNYFGDVPLVLNTDYRVNTSLPRTASNLVYDAIIADLLDAQTLLSANYPTAERVRANSAAATALLARVYLYTQQWSKAEAEATKVISDTKYSLLADLNTVFLKNSSEAIWQLQTVNTSTAGVNTWEGFSIVPTAPTTAPLYKFYPDFMATFEANDKRQTAWTKTFTNASVTIDYPVKYKVRTGTSVTEYSMTIRFAEMFLIRAEARAQQDKADLAKEDLTSIRNRAGLLPLPLTMTKAEILAAVEKERKLELFGEWGHRWFDLKRTGRAMAVLTPIKTGLTTTDLLYPIPLAALNTNPNLVPNP